jgi:hypothetical protein
MPSARSSARASSAWWAVGLAGALLVLSGCATGSLSSPETSASASVVAIPPTSKITGPTVIVTVPDLVPTDAVPPATAPAEPAPAAEAPAAPTEAAALTEDAATEQAPSEPAETAAEQPAATVPPAAPPAEPAPPPGDGLNVSLANCDGCTVLATHRAVTGELSAALVGTGSGRAILLSVAGDGQVSGVIGVPYGAAFSAPDGGVLACAQGRCVVQGRQSDGRAILSAFELTGTGAWRDVSGDDAFPSATERAAVIDLDGELGIVVQDQGDGAAVWMLYTWGGDRYAVVGCAADGAAPVSASAVSPGMCLS